MRLQSLQCRELQADYPLLKLRPSRRTSALSSERAYTLLFSNSVDGLCTLVLNL
jgi:hypothetical protein